MYFRGKNTKSMFSDYATEWISSGSPPEYRGIKISGVRIHINKYLQSLVSTDVLNSCFYQVQRLKKNSTTSTWEWTCQEGLHNGVCYVHFASKFVGCLFQTYWNWGVCGVVMAGNNHNGERIHGKILWYGVSGAVLWLLGVELLGSSLIDFLCKFQLRLGVRKLLLDKGFDSTPNYF